MRPATQARPAPVPFVLPFCQKCGETPARVGPLQRLIPDPPMASAAKAQPAAVARLAVWSHLGPVLCLKPSPFLICTAGVCFAGLASVGGARVSCEPPCVWRFPCSSAGQTAGPFRGNAPSRPHSDAGLASRTENRCSSQFLENHRCECAYVCVFYVIIV